jgi:hypothetical protein
MSYTWGMKLLLAALLLLPAAARAEGRLGVGVVAGVPFGVTAKYEIDARSAAQSHLGVSDGDLTWNADFLRLFPDALPRRRPDLRAPLYAGLGLKIKSERRTFAGIRFVGGVSLYDSKRPYEFFAEVAPVLRFAPSEGGAFDGAVGVRRYF